MGELSVLIAALFGAGGIVLGSLRREWRRSDRSDDAYIKARQDASAEERLRIDELRAEFQAELARRDAEHRADIAALEEHIARLHRAVAAIVPLVAPENVAEVTKILVELGLPRTNITSNEEDQ